MNSIRYKYIENTLGVAFATSNYSYTNDGDDKKEIFIKRKLAAADIGTGAGQTRATNGLGAIIDVLPSTVNIVAISFDVLRPQTPVSGVTPYVTLMGIVAPFPTLTNQENFQIAVGLDNSIRIIDAGAIAGVQLAAGDLIQVRILIGANVNTNDTMN